MIKTAESVTFLVLRKVVLLLLAIVSCRFERLPASSHIDRTAFRRFEDNGLMGSNYKIALQFFISILHIPPVKLQACEEHQLSCSPVS
ncbi:hypothetical protein M758_8G129300 [Ceratodon purpureus]|nr:hypothetical protein M758_8G129300 [Ceratodon purpureus]